MPKTDIVSISDIHIGDNSVACWYHNSFHDGYLKRILEYVVSNKDNLKEFIILGDLFDFWTYTPDTRPPTTQEIITANTGTPENPGIFGKGNMLDTAVTAMEGNVSYVVGNHDISITQADLNLIPLTDFQITKQDDEYPVGKTLFTHGHVFTVFNAPPIREPHVTPPKVPLGHFVTRMIAHYVATQTPVVPAWQMTGFGAPAQRDLLQFSHFFPILGFVRNMFGTGAFGPDSIRHFIDLWQQTTNFPVDGNFIMADGTTKTLDDVKTEYANLFTQWIDLHGKEYVRKSIVTDAMARSMSWFTQQASLKSDVDLCVTGHTHWPTKGVKALVNDVNCGFECFAEPDADSSRYTFARIANAETNPVPTIYQITADPSGAYLCNPAVDIPKGEIIFNPLSLPVPPQDFSCFLRVINNSTKDLTYVSNVIGHGKWVLAPTTIAAGATKGFWIQDLLSWHGVDAVVNYTLNGSEVVMLIDCPTGFYNNIFTVTGPGASSITYKARIGDGTWSTTVPTAGHPLCIEITVT